MEGVTPRSSGARRMGEGWVLGNAYALGYVVGWNAHAFRYSVLGNAYAFRYEAVIQSVARRVGEGARAPAIISRGKRGLFSCFSALEGTSPR